MKKYTIITFGCQMNDHDSEMMAGLLEHRGYQRAQKQEEAEIIVLNTCCVRETAENKVFGLLGRLGQRKKQQPDLIIAMGGCMSQQEHTGQTIKQRFKYVDIVFGTHNIYLLPDLIAQVENHRRQLIDIWPDNPEVIEGLKVKRASNLRSWVSIMYGCDNFCTYCIVPYVRGREKSRRPENIIREIEELTANGCREVTLLGQNVNSYGKDLNLNCDFAELLTLVNDISGLDRIRYVTSHPKDFSDKLINALAGLEKVCEHIHLPVQAGSNRLLEQMNRGYTREYYLALVEKIRASIPGVSLTTDIMVGFPGETEEDFLDTMDLVRQIEFDSAYTFVYNKRRGTPAADMENQVPQQVKTDRIKRLIDFQNKLSLHKNKMDEGKTMPCLVEGPSKTNANLMSSRTRTNKTVIFPGSQDTIGQTLWLKITGSTLTHLEGEREV